MTAHYRSSQGSKLMDYDAYFNIYSFIQDNSITIYNTSVTQNNHQSLLIPRQLRATLARRETPLGLHKHLLHAILLLLKLIIHLIQILQPDTVCDHIHWLNLFILDHLEQALPVQMHRRLPITNEPDTALHQRANVEVVRETDVHTRDAAAPKVARTCNHLVDELARVCLQTEHHLKVVRPALCVLAGCGLDADIWAAVVAHFLEDAGHGLALAELGVVDGFDVRVCLLDEIEAPVCVDDDDLRGAVEQRKFSRHLANGSAAPDGDDIALLHARIDNGVPGCAEHVGEEEALFIGYIVGKGEEVHVAVGNASVF